MALEDRVNALESEFNILKNQIQNTLLEIQEQVLVHYYPALRAEESATPASVPPATRRNGASSQSTAVPTVRDRTPDSIVSPNQPTIGNAPSSVVGDVDSWSHAEPVTPSPPHPSTPDRVPAQAVAEQGVDLSTFIGLMDWVSDSIESIGRDRTEKAIEIYAQGGYLDAKVMDTLVQLISLSDEDNPPQKVGMTAIFGTLARLNAVLGNQSDITEAFQLLQEETVG